MELQQLLLMAVALSKLRGKEIVHFAAVANAAAAAAMDRW